MLRASIKLCELVDKEARSVLILRSFRFSGMYCPSANAMGVGSGVLGGLPCVVDATTGQQVFYVQMGETVYFHLGDSVQCIPGPATVSFTEVNPAEGDSI